MQEIVARATYPCDSFSTIRCTRGGCSSLFGGLLCNVNCHSIKIWSRPGEIRRRLRVHEGYKPCLRLRKNILSELSDPLTGPRPVRKLISTKEFRPRSD